MADLPEDINDPDIPESLIVMRSVLDYPWKKKGEGGMLAAYKDIWAKDKPLFLKMYREAEDAVLKFKMQRMKAQADKPDDPQTVDVGTQKALEQAEALVAEIAARVKSEH